MKAKDSRYLIVDASVAQAAGESSAPNSKASREFLTAMMKICHRILFSTALRDEWQQHASRFTRTWRAEMVSKKKMNFVCPTRSSKLLNAIEEHGRTAKQRTELKKDAHLIQVSLDQSAPIVSLDEKARDLFARIIPDFKEVGSVIWVNPTKSSERAIEWLQQGAPSEPERTLKAHAESKQ